MYSVLLFFTVMVLACAGNRPPNIVIIIADDLGSNDVSYRGSDQFTTANIDALGYNGIILNRHYTAPICTPSRAALLTGQNPSKLGLQGNPIRAGEDRHLPTNIETLPSLLKKLGYATHLVGKWHLGYARREETPTRRGFDSHYGYWNGHVGYFTYKVNGPFQQGDEVYRGFDLKQNLTDSWKDQGTYATELFTKEALKVIEEQDKKVPMFLLLAHLAVHTGDYEKVEVRDEKKMNESFGYIENLERRKFAAALMDMDKSVGLVVGKLEEQRMLDNTVVIFMSDNGAMVTGMYYNGGSNYPLRGGKISLHEGGIRNAAVVYSPLLKKKNYVYEHPVHITDWLPTLYSIAGGDVSELKNLDGVNQWENLSGNLPNNRRAFLANIDETVPRSAVIGQGGRYKLVNGSTSSLLETFGDEPITPKTLTYNISAVLNSFVNRATKKSCLTVTTIESLRKTASSVRSNKNCLDKEKRKSPEICTNLCLFDLFFDPCETENLANDVTKKDILEDLKAELNEFWKVMVPQTNKPVDVDSDPSKYNGTWCTWRDDEFCVKTPVKL